MILLPTLTVILRLISLDAAGMMRRSFDHLASVPYYSTCLMISHVGLVFLVS